MKHILNLLLAATRGGVLVLLCAFLLVTPSLAAGSIAPAATALRATTNGAATRITIAGTAPMAHAIRRPDQKTLLVELPGVDASKLATTYNVTTPLVSSLSVERPGDSSKNLSTRLRIELRAPVRERLHLSDNDLILELTPFDVQEVAANKVAAAPSAPAVEQQQQQRPSGIAPASGASSPQQSQGQQYGQPGFVGEPINLNVVNADIRDILNYITEQYGVNFVIDSSVKAVPVTVNVTEVPWNIALDSILKANRLGIEVTGNILRVATREVLVNEAAAQERIRDAQLDATPLVTEFIRLNYARASGTLAQAAGSTGGFAGGTTSDSFSGGSGGDATGGSGDQGILPIIRRRLSRRGAVEVDGRSNTIIVTDVKQNIDAVRQLVTLLDQPEPQVEIETRIVIANRNFSRDLGVQLNAIALNTSNGANFGFNTAAGSPASGTGGGATNTIGLRPGGLPQGILNPSGALGANLPSTVIGLTTGAIGTAQISALITAAESKGQAKIVATPRVTALNNRPAQIEAGQQIPVITPQVGAGGSGALLFTTTFVSVPLRLSVTPQISDAGTVILRVVAENNSVNTTIAIAGTPGIDTQRMQTEVLVPDGGTTVVGGVLADNESDLQNRTPGLASLPLVGNLFKRKSISRQTNEILFFITPRIYRPNFQGLPTLAGQPGIVRTGTISQPVPLGNPSSNTPTPTQLQQQQQQSSPLPAPASPATTTPVPARTDAPPTR